jgi:hypothetical protein
LGDLRPYSVSSEEREMEKAKWMEMNALEALWKGLVKQGKQMKCQRG